MKFSGYFQHFLDYKALLHGLEDLIFNTGLKNSLRKKKVLLSVQNICETYNTVLVTNLPWRLNILLFRSPLNPEDYSNKGRTILKRTTKKYIRFVVRILCTKIHRDYHRGARSITADFSIVRYKSFVTCNQLSCKRFGSSLLIIFLLDRINVKVYLRNIHLPMR